MAAANKTYNPVDYDGADHAYMRRGEDPANRNSVAAAAEKSNLADIWPFLSKAPLWPTYYANSANIRFYDGKGQELEAGVRFYFETFGFPVEAQVVEYAPPADGKPGRLAWLVGRRRYTA